MVVQPVAGVAAGAGHDEPELVVVVQRPYRDACEVCDLPDRAHVLVPFVCEGLCSLTPREVPPHARGTHTLGAGCPYGGLESNARLQPVADQEHEHVGGDDASTGQGMGAGIAIGVALGVAFMPVMGPAGLAVGIACGVAFGVAFQQQRVEDADTPDGDASEDEA